MQKKEETQNVALFIGTDECIATTKQTLLSETVQSDEMIEQLRAAYMDQKFTDLKDLKGFEFMVDGSKKLKKLRTSVEKKRKEFTEPALAFQKEVKKYADETLIAPIKEIEDHLNHQIEMFKDAELQEREKKFAERVEMLSTNGYHFAGEHFVCGVMSIHQNELVAIDDESFQQYIEAGKREVERKQAEEKRIQAEREETQRLREELAKEREELRKMREELAKEREEITAQKTALDETYSEIEKTPEIEEKQPEQVLKAASEPEPQPTVEEKPAFVDDEPSKVQSEYENGFDLFRSRLIELLDSPDKFTRQTLKQWAIDQKI